jgi:hypothetical protein
LPISWASRNLSIWGLQPPQYFIPISFIPMLLDFKSKPVNL